jgi:hypothetical protein
LAIQSPSPEYSFSLPPIPLTCSRVRTVFIGNTIVCAVTPVHAVGVQYSKQQYYYTIHT